MTPAFIGIDVAIAKGKLLPISICTWEGPNLIPKRLRQLTLAPPQGIGNALAIDNVEVSRFARDAREYVSAVCEHLRLTPTRIGIDAPSSPCDVTAPRRAAELALDLAGISCFATPSADGFEMIRQKVTLHLGKGGREDRIPHSNQLWMLAGFAIFRELSRLAPCLEVFPQATVRAMGGGQKHKSQSGAVEEQMAAAAPYTGWPLGKQSEPLLHEIAWGAAHDQLDAYLSAWVASLEPSIASVMVDPLATIWVPTFRGAPLHPPSTMITTPREPRDRNHEVSSSAQSLNVLLCPACGQKEFKRWPWGWDAHAAHSCAGLSGTNPEGRKIEFRHRFADHFRQ